MPKGEKGVNLKNANNKIMEPIITEQQIPKDLDHLAKAFRERFETSLTLGSNKMGNGHDLLLGAAGTSGQLAEMLYNASLKEQKMEAVIISAAMTIIARQTNGRFPNADEFKEVTKQVYDNFREKENHYRSILKQPEGITPCYIDALLMPDGEIMCFGKSIGHFKNLQKFLITK